MNLKSLFLNNINLKQTILKNTFWLMMAEGISKTLSFFLTILMVRYLGAEGYGKFIFAFAFTALFAVLTDFGLSTLTIREVARNKSLARKYIDNIAIIKLILGVIIFALIVITIPFLGKTPEVKTFVYLAGIWVIIQSFTQLFQSIFRAFEKMEYEALSKIIYSVILFGITFFVISRNLGINCLFQSHIYTAIIVLIIALFLVRKKITKFWVEIDFRFWKDLLKDAWPFALSAIFFTIYSKIGITILSVMKGDSITGIYTSGLNLFLAVFMISEFFNISLYPVVSKYYSQYKVGSIKVIIKKSVLFGLIVSVPISLLLFFFKKAIILFIYGSQFIGATVVFPFFCAYTVIHFILHPFGTILTCTNQQKAKVKYQFLVAVINVVCNIVLIGFFGYIGAAMAIVISETFLLIFYATKAMKLDKLMKG